MRTTATVTVRRTSVRRRLVAFHAVPQLCCLLAVALFGKGTLSFAPSVTRTATARYCPQSSGTRLLALKRMKGESEKAFFQRVTAAASDPAAFERMVMTPPHKTESTTKLKSMSGGVTTNGTASVAAFADGDGDCAEETNKGSGYVRAEDWEAERARKRQSGEMSWEERVQFEGQRQGDRFKQNEILRHNLNAW